MSEEEPRRPRNMQGLLNFCTQLTIKEDAPNNPSLAMDPQRREFLQNVMSNLSVNHAKQIAAHLQTLASSVDIHETMADTDAEEAALEDLVEIVQDVDNAIDLMKMGGIPVLLSCLYSVHNAIMELSCEVLGVVCQNNPKCQDAVLNSGALSTLLLMLDKPSALSTRAKALYAVSCLVRGYGPGMKAFDELDGFSHLMRVMQDSVDKLFVKAVFLIAALIEEYQPAVEQLLSMGYTELLVNYLCSSDLNGQTTCATGAHTASHQAKQSPATTNGDDTTPSSSCTPVTTADISKEHCTSALLKLCSVSDEARRLCSSNDDLKLHLNDRLLQVKHVEEYQEESDYISELLKLFSKESYDAAATDDTEEVDSR